MDTVLKKERIRVKIGREVYIFTGGIVSEDNTRLIIDDWKEGKTDIRKEDIITRQDVKEVSRDMR